MNAELPDNWIDEAVAHVTARLNAMSDIEVILEYVKVFDRSPSPFGTVNEIRERIVSHVRQVLTAQ